jgi:bis(5'-nucleosyl)-tetraphosphatase (symmetrical)
MRARQPIFVGDVQGCADEFDELLERAAAAFGDGFELWLVGDLVNRGPYNLRILRRVRELADAGRARCVLGNHDVNLLRVAAGQRKLSPVDSVRDVLEAPDADEWIEWLRRRPLAATGRLGDHPFALVHAAVHPDWDLAELERRARRVEARLGCQERREAEGFLACDPARDPDLDTLRRVINCRSVTPSGEWSSEPPELLPADFRPWHEEWSARGHGYGVVYGHWALQGLHLAPGLRGLDTGCVHAGPGQRGALTAWLPDPSLRAPFDLPDGRFWRIPARRAYYAHRDLPENGHSTLRKKFD